MDKVEEALTHINHALRASGEREVSSDLVGEKVMQELRKLDEVAYVRFASVYRSFKDLNEFREAIDNIDQASKDKI